MSLPLAGLSQEKPLVVVVEDEGHLAQGLLYNLDAEGYRTHHEADGDDALAWLLSTEETPAIILLDVMLPGRDGFSIVRALRAAGKFTPVLMLTARGRSEDVVEGFEAGADDYVAKPFDLGVLIVRLAALLRRVGWQATKGPAEDAPMTESESIDIFVLGERTIDFQALEIRSAGAAVHLTLMEAELLRYLINRPGKVVARKEILENVWHVRDDTDTRAIDNFIVRLRRYLEPDPGKPIYFITVRGVGYRFMLPA